MALEVRAAIWERAFQLAYFVLMDRPNARECVARALEKLVAQQSREKRRSYWRSRKKDLTIRRISRPAEDTLQWLVYLESEVSEKRQESHGLPTEADMVVRYVKHLAQLTTVNSSFHVNVGFNRLLRNYTTPEVQQVYELATARYPAAEEYRKAKGKLLKQLATRFERFLRIRTAQFGELQFETHVAHEYWSGLVEQCLEFFAPWSARPSCFGKGHAQSVAAKGRAVPRGSSRLPDRLETSRCHWFMHSTCYGRLVEQLGFDPPGERLSVPRFLHHDGGDSSSTPASLERRTTPLSDEETRLLRERMDALASQRHELAAGPLKVIAHGTVCATLDPGCEEHRSFEIPQDTQLIEVWSDAAADSQIVATHWIDYDDNGHFVAGEYTIALQPGRQLALSVTPNSHSDEQGLRHANVTIKSHTTGNLAWRLRSLGSMLSPGAHLLRPVLASVAWIALGALGSVIYFQSRVSQDRAVIGRLQREVTARQQQANTAPEHAPASPSRPVVHYSFNAVTPNLRGPGAGEAVVTLPAGDALAVLELPVQNGEHGVYRVTLSSFPQERERLTEAALQPLRRGDRWIVEFALPALLVASDSHYLLTLTSTTGTDSAHYLFEVRKNSAISTH